MTGLTGTILAAAVVAGVVIGALATASAMSIGQHIATRENADLQAVVKAAAYTAGARGQAEASNRLHDECIWLTQLLRYERWKGARWRRLALRRISHAR